MPFRFLRGSWTRLALSVLALAAGVALVCAMDLVNRAVMRAFGEVIDTMAGRASLQVTPGIGGAFPEAVTDAVRAVPGVELAVPVVSGVAYATDGSGETITVQGVDIASDATVRVYMAQGADGSEIDDPLSFLNDPDSILLTQAFARKRGLAVNDRITLEAPAGRRAFKVRGLLNPQGVGQIFGGNLAIMDVFAAQAIFTRPQLINRIDVVVRPDHDVASVAQAISAAIPAGLQVERPAQRKDALHNMVRSMHTLLAVISAMGLVAAFLIIFSRLTTLFDGRAWQLAVMRAVGVRRRTVHRELMKEAVVLGVLGVAVGIPLGIALGGVFRPIVAAATALTLEMVVPEADVGVRPRSLALAAALGLGTAVLAAALPAWRAARVEIVQSIRGRGVEQADIRWAPAHLLRGAIAAAVVAAIAIQHVSGSPTWGLVATFLITVLAASAARPLLALNRLLLRGRVARSIGPATRFAAATIDQSPRRTALAVGMLGIGIGVVAWIWIMAASFERSLAAVLREVARCDLLVTSTHTVGGHVEAPVDEELLEHLGRVPGVARVTGSRMIDSTHRGTIVTVDGLDPSYFEDPRFGKLPVVGEHVPDLWGSVARGEAAVVSMAFVHTFGARIGDSITLETPGGPLRLTVGGVTSFFEAPRPLIAVSRAVLQKRWNDRQVNRAMVLLEPGAETAAVREEIARRWGSTYRLRLLSTTEFIEQNLIQARRAFGAFHALGAMVLLVVLIGLADTLAASVLEAQRQFGTLRALGIRRGILRRLVHTEGLLLGLLGLLLAIVAGFSLAVLWVDATAPLLLGFDVELHLPWNQLTTLAVLAVAVSVAAGVLPAYRTSRLQPAAALRDE